MDQNRITEVKMTMVLIDINERLVSHFSEINHNTLESLLVWLRSRYHISHMVGDIFTLC